MNRISLLGGEGFPIRFGWLNMPAKPSGKGISPRGGGQSRAPDLRQAFDRAQSRPFCSDRCRDVDLNRWLSGSYVVPGRPDEDEDNE